MTSKEGAERAILRPKPLLIAWACRGRWPLIIFAATCGFASFWKWVVMSPVITFGAQGKTFYSPAHGRQGEPINWCVEDVVIFRICRSTEILRLTPERGHPIDLTHLISPKDDDGGPMKKPGRIKPKCRITTVPKWDDVTEGIGNAVLTGYVSSFCWPFTWVEVIDPFPTVKLTIDR